MSPLRARREDIPLLVDAIVGRLARMYRWSRLAVTSSAMQSLTRLRL
jgi:DNA-binding NtrC family response regulator